MNSPTQRVKSDTEADIEWLQMMAEREIEADKLRAQLKQYDGDGLYVNMAQEYGATQARQLWEKNQSVELPRAA